MILSKRNIYILLFLYVFILSLFYSSINFNAINYLAGNIKGLFYYSEVRHEDGDFKIMDVAAGRYTKPYKRLPDELLHFGNSLFYRAWKGDSVRDIANKVISYTNFYRANRLKNAIIEYNGLKDAAVPFDMFLYVPFSLSSIVPDSRNIKKPDLIYTRGLYYTGNSAGDENFGNMVARYRNLGINTVVFDAKDVTGDLNYFSKTEMAVKYNTHEKKTIDNIDKMLRVMKEQGVYTIARIAVFRDHFLCKKNPDFAIRSKRTGGRWNPASREIWCDPTNKFVQDYNIQLAIELAEKGVDEIQFDYIRFPTIGDLNDAAYAYHFGKMSKEAAITNFLQRAYSEISKRNVLLSIDIFGVVAWEKEIDIEKTGQRIGLLSNYCDIISPMLYPSHFDDDFDGFSRPGDEPYYFIYTGCKKTKALAKGKPVRPWLQAFGWRITPSNYNEDYIMKQIAGCRDAGASGYLFWNASNSYDIIYRSFYKLSQKLEANNNAVRGD